MERIIDNPACQTSLCHCSNGLDVVVLIEGYDFKTPKDAFLDELPRFFSRDPAGQGQGGKHSITLRQTVGGTETIVVA
jgi:hypothetical protein